MPYTPPQEILERYADVLVNWALHGGEGMRPGEVVRVQAEYIATPLADEIAKAVWRAGGHVLAYPHLPGGDQSHLSPAFYEVATEAQITYFPEKLLRGLAEEMNHEVVVYSDAHPHMLSGVAPDKLVRWKETMRPFREWRDEKENRGEYSWTLCEYGTEGIAKEAGITVEEYWAQIIRACFLDDPDPVARWRESFAQIDRHREQLDALRIERVHLEGADVDLWVQIGEKRLWKTGKGFNMPSFEIFTTPNWRGTNGWIRFNQPLYAFGSLITGIRLEFKDGLVVSAQADQNLELLQQIISSQGGDRLGEFSLTDARASRIDRFMANTLYDENMGGPFGNTHVALGSAYQDVYDGDPNTVSDSEWDRLGFNNSAIHEDIVSTSDRTVTAQLADGSERVIYAGGHFQLD